MGAEQIQSLASRTGCRDRIWPRRQDSNEYVQIDGVVIDGKDIHLPVFNNGGASEAAAAHSPMAAYEKIEPTGSFSIPFANWRC
ncbi:hypothetical protein [Cohnella faecalis]|uniref:hypothetical protein n=1 Tax=Cohnella faecalis TaxID=2315694 RepID=UPI001F2E21E9|nr:hypothetical protein [Cohnella faecalis]